MTAWPVPPGERHRPLPAPSARSTCVATSPAPPGERRAPLPVVPVAERGDCRWHERHATPPPSVQYLGSPRPSLVSSRSVWSCCSPSAYGSGAVLHHISNPRCSTRLKVVISHLR